MYTRNWLHISTNEAWIIRKLRPTESSQCCQKQLPGSQIGHKEDKSTKFTPDSEKPRQNEKLHSPRRYWHERLTFIFAVVKEKRLENRVTNY